MVIRNYNTGNFQRIQNHEAWLLTKIQSCWHSWLWINKTLGLRAPRERMGLCYCLFNVQRHACVCLHLRVSSYRDTSQYIWIWSGKGVTQPISAISLFSSFFTVVKMPKKTALAIEYDVFSWKVSPQLSCSDNFQIGILLNPHSRKVVAGWMWTGRLLILLE